MKIHTTIVLFFLTIYLPCNSYGQGGTWTWMHGSSTSNSAGSYGTKGVAAMTNEPPARYQACYWTDKQGNFWMFGGAMGIAYSATGGNDLWKYDVSTNMWTWVNGPNFNTSPNPAGVYGTKGIPSSNNYPAGRGFGANSWTDNNGDLWLYGGKGGHDDLWKYNIASNQWTWVFGNNVATTPVLGTMGVPAAANTPGDLEETTSAWVDAANNLWMFGGSEHANYYTYNRLWRYTISTGMWTWMNGSSTFNDAGNYGTYRVETSANQPPARFSYTRWKDANDNMYLFGGYTQFLPGGNLNDVWRYRPGTNTWTWVSGSKVARDPGAYPPQKCRFYDNYFPASRYENPTASSANSCVKAFWMFGGADGNINDLFNDLWLFDVDSLKWSWMSGSSLSGATGSYGSKGVPAASNVPPGKGGHCMWVDKKNNVWIFGGWDRKNDLWRFQPDTTCYKARSAHTLPDTLLCQGDTSVLNVGTHRSVRWSPGNFVIPNADSSILKFFPPANTAYVVTIAGGDCVDNDTLHFTLHIIPKDTIKLVPPTPLRICIGDSVKMIVKPGWTIAVTPNTAVTYQATGGNTIVFYPNSTTTYTVTATVNSKCAHSADSIRFAINTDEAPGHLAPFTDTTLCKADTAIYLFSSKPSSLSIAPVEYQNVSSDGLVARFYPPVTTRYRIIAAESTGCKYADTLYFTIYRSTLKASFILSPKETDINNPVFQLTNTSIGANYYSWYQNLTFLSSQRNTIATVTDTGSLCFTLIASDWLNCIDTAIECGRVIDPHIYVPSAFSPNGDGLNDVFKAISKDVKILELSVYNRWGEHIFGSYTDNRGWDGTFHGKACDVGTYFYLIRYRILDREPVKLKGDINLIR